MKLSEIGISEITFDWEVIPCGYFFKEKSIKNNFGEINLSVYRDYGVIPRDTRDDNHNRISEDISNYKLVNKGDFVLNKMKCWMGSLGVSNYRGIVSPSYTVLEPKREIHNQYFHYLLRSEEYRQIYESLSYGVRVGQWELRFHDFKGIPAIYPKIEEQALISKYLDKKTQNIAYLIENIKKKIELLKELKTALINQYVKRGLELNIEMKDSGVERIGKIPKHWKLSKIKYVAELNGRIGYRGYTVDDIVAKDDGAISLGPSNISDDKLTLEKNVYISWEKYHESPEIKLYEGDIVLVKTASIGKVAYINEGGRELTLNPQLVKIKCRDMYSKYLYFFLRSNFYKDQILSSKEGGSTPTISQNKILNHLIIVPPLNEQKLISEFLSNQIEKIDKLILLTEKKIDLLHEYHKSLISSTVTGKIRISQDML